MTRDEDFLSRWSRRKHAIRKGEDVEAAPPVPAAAPAARAPAESHEPREALPLPPVESLTPESDFAPFMQGEVDPLVRRRALRTLFSDPRFNVMDGLDVYIDDYSKPDPIPAEWFGKMQQMARLGDYAAAEEKSAEDEGVSASPDQAAIAPEIQDLSPEEPQPPADVSDAGPSEPVPGQT